MNKLSLKGRYDVWCIDKSGNIKWHDIIDNIVTTQGKNHLLDYYLAGSAYTASFFFGLISSVSYTGPAASDTAAQINGSNQCKEAGASFAPNYSETTRRTSTFGAAATSGFKTVSVASSFTMTEIGTLKGIFMITESTKNGTSGALISAGTFSGGDKVVAISEIVLVSYTLSL